jgi:hypothetical protein
VGARGVRDRPLRDSDGRVVAYVKAYAGDEARRMARGASASSISITSAPAPPRLTSPASWRG